MCQLIVFWHICSHLILSTMKCPFDGATTHEEETTATALVDYPCWLCKQGRNHAQWEKVSRVRSAILTVEQMEFILNVSSYERDFLPRVAGFYARGDHKRWGQPGENKAKYTQKDSYIESLELEIALAERGERAFPMNPGLMFDLEIALAKRFDVENYKPLFWPLRGWREPSMVFYSASTMLKLLPSIGEQGVLKMTACDGEEIYGCQFAPQSATAGSMFSTSSGPSQSATSLSLCQTNNTWSASFPDRTFTPTAQSHVPTFCDSVPAWMQWQNNSHPSVGEAKGPSTFEKLFGFDAYSVNDTVLPDPCSATQKTHMGTPMSGGTVIQNPVDYQMTGTATATATELNPIYPGIANGANISYPAGNPIQAPDISLPAPLACDMLPFGYGYTTPRPISSNASTDMSPMSPQRCPTEQQQQQQQQQQQKQEQPVSTQNPFGYGSSHQFLSASIPMCQAQVHLQTQAQAQTLTYQTLHPPQQQQLQSQAQVQPSHKVQFKTSITSPSPKKFIARKPRLSGSNLFRSHGPPSKRYLTPLPCNPGTPAIKMYETPERKTFSTPVMGTTGTSSDADMEDVNTDSETYSSSPSPSTRRRRRTVSGTGTKITNAKGKVRDTDKEKSPMRGSTIMQAHGPVDSCTLMVGGFPSQDHIHMSAPGPAPGPGIIPNPGHIPGLGFDPVPMMMGMLMPITPQRGPVQSNRTPIMTQSTSSKNVSSSLSLSGERKRKLDRDRDHSRSCSRSQAHL